MPTPLTAPVRAMIIDMLQQAHQAGRHTLYEHEVYAILKAFGLRAPVHAVVKNANHISDRFLSMFGSNKVVLKVVSAEVAHKQAAGGVEVVYKDPAFVRYRFTEMLRRFAERNVSVDSILFVEHVAYTQELGNEIMLGFRESEAFGPVISFSKGGSDAEHFAKHFSAPNLILAPIDGAWARALLESTHIHQKYLQQGHGDYVPRIVEAGVCFSEMAVAFSNFFPNDTGFAFTEFEVNPFVFTPDGRFLAIDGFASFAPAAPQHAVGPPATQTLKPFFDPCGVAVVGVSTSDRTKSGNIIVENLFKLGRSDVYAVNPKGGILLLDGKELPLYASLKEIPHPVDLAIVTVPAAACMAVMADCATKRIPAAILIPSGFSEIAQHRDLEAEIRELAMANQIRVMGPNCLGIITAGGNDQPGVNTFFIPEEKFAVNLGEENNVVLLSQSGALGIIELENLKNAISPKVIVSYGNQLDVDVCDLVDFFQQDPSVSVISCYIEGFKPGAGRRFFDIAARGEKPVVVYKAGRTEAGQKATESHTASIAGEYAVAKAAMKQAGLIVADSMIDHGDFIKTFALMADFTVKGNRVAIIANAGYEKTLAADHLGNLELARFDARTEAALNKILPPMVVPDPLLDLTPMADDATFEGSIEAVLAADGVDALMVSIVPQSTLIHTTDAEIDTNPDNIAARIVRLVHRYRKPTAVSVNVVSNADAVYNKLGKTLDAGGVPTYLTANRAMRCLNAFIRYRLLRDGAPFSEWLR
ncbi:MAG: acetate--CoA ligase family protein [Desulfosarcinaceae bacterium]|nr:acetate--CoA ligase family protein [Desulfosarcinaceae bacterium]